MMRIAILCLSLLTACTQFDSGQRAAEMAKQAELDALAQTPHPDSINGQLARPWRHFPAPVTEQRFYEDQNKCKLAALQTPVQPAGTPEITHKVAFITCMKGSGYRPE